MGLEAGGPGGDATGLCLQCERVNGLAIDDKSQSLRGGDAARDRPLGRGPRRQLDVKQLIEGDKKEEKEKRKEKRHPTRSGTAWSAEQARWKTLPPAGRRLDKESSWGDRMLVTSPADRIETIDGNGPGTGFVRTKTTADLPWRETLETPVGAGSGPVAGVMRAALGCSDGRWRPWSSMAWRIVRPLRWGTQEASSCVHFRSCQSRRATP